MKPPTVSQIARHTGLTVRALHHYEKCGLLQPAQRSAAGYRLYGEVELRRLQHVVPLKTLGLPLNEIRAGLDNDAPSLAEALTRQVHRLRESIAHQRDLLRRLEVLAQRADLGETIDAETLLPSIEASTIMEKYPSTEQLDLIKQRSEHLGPERIRAVEQTWPHAIAGMQAAMQLDKDPSSAEVRPLALKWRSFVREFTGGNAGIHNSLNTMFRDEAPAMQASAGIDPTLMTYASRAIAALDD
jgi:DNA-binding transcriptional MerR regulator